MWGGGWVGGVVVVVVVVVVGGGGGGGWECHLPHVSHVVSGPHWSQWSEISDFQMPIFATFSSKFYLKLVWDECQRSQVRQQAISQNIVDQIFIH